MSPSERIDHMLATTSDWRAQTLATVRRTLLDADPGIIEEWKWMGSPTWSLDGIIAVGNMHKGKVKLTFAHGADLPDPDRLFNAGLGGKAWRAIDFLEGDRVRVAALTALVRAAVAHNQSKKRRGVAPKASP